MRKFLQKATSWVAARLGFELHPFAPIDLRDRTEHSIEAWYLAGRRRFLIEVPLLHCRGLYGLPLDNLHPFVRTARALIDGKIHCYSGSPLQRYYDHFQPQHAAELLELPASSPLSTAPAFCVVWPWQSGSISDKAKARLERASAINRQRGLPLDLSHGHSSFGPVSEQKGHLEFAALARLVAQVREKGYLRRPEPDGDIQVIALNDELSETRFLIRTGQHRAAVMAALGFERVPAVVIRHVRKVDLNHWPHVKDGLFSRDQARSIFDRLFSGTPPLSAIPPEWVK
jgi:hypothetical protein